MSDGPASHDCSLHDPPHVQVLTEGRPSSSEDPGVVGQAAATCVTGTVGRVEDENSAAATCVAGRGSRHRRVS